MVSPRDGLTFQQMLTGDGFFYGAEIVTTRGITEPDKPNKLVELGEALAQDPRIGWLSLTDNPGGNPMLPPDWLARMLAGRQVELVIHLTCKDLNRNGLESAAWRYAAEHFDNVLALTGDYPAAGYGGQARGVFDLDSVGLIALLDAMNRGLEIPGRGPRQPQKLPATQFFIGCAVSPFKRHEREYMPQLFKLARKIQCGAKWVICQLGYDSRKFQEVMLFLRRANLNVPVIGNAFVLNRTVAGLFHQRKIPGCVVSDALDEHIQRHAGGPDKGQAFFYELAAKQLAIFRGMGMAAGYLGGTGKPEVFARVIDMAESYAPGDWRDFVKEIRFNQPEEFYLFEEDDQTALSDGNQVNRQYVESLREPPRPANVTLGYRVMRKVHDLGFNPDRGQFERMRRLYQKLNTDKKPAAAVAHALHVLERTAKSAGFGCRDCGDCALPDCAFLCPSASCSKGARNGPCGGSDDGRCELHDKDCLWARAYERLKYYGESEHMLDGPAVFYNASLNGSSAWANFYQGRDHNHLTQGENSDGH